MKEGALKEYIKFVPAEPKPKSEPKLNRAWFRVLKSYPCRIASGEPCDNEYGFKLYPIEAGTKISLPLKMAWILFDAGFGLIEEII